jgi:hypothetical protein
MKTIGEVFATILFGAFVLSYVMVFRKYKLAVEKH